MCLGGGGNKTEYKDEKPLGSDTKADGGFTQRRNDYYRKKAATDSTASVAPKIGGGSDSQAGVVIG